MNNFTRFLPLIAACFLCLGARAQTCPSGLGTTVNIASLPYTGTGLTTCGAGNEITSSNATVCGSGSYYGGEDLVFIFTPSATGSITISLTTSSSWTGMMLYNGCPFLGQGGSCVGNVQSSSGSKTLTVSLTSGVTYYLVVDTWPSPNCIPSFDLSIPAPAGSSDPCSSITTLSCGAAVSATPSGAGVWSVTNCGFSTPGQEKVYSFTPTTTGVYNLQVNSVTGGYIDYFYKAASGGCNASGWTCIDDINFTGTYTIGTLTAGVQYYILLDPEGTGAYNHNFQIVCPAADPCASLTTLACATSATATLVGTGVWNNSTCFFSTPGQEKLYSFTPTVTGVHTLQVTSASGTGYIDYQYKAASGGCSATGWTCIDDVNFTGTFTIGTLTAGVQYYILLDAESATSSTQNFQINCPSAPDPCSGITTLACATPATATLTGTGVWNNSTCLFSTPGQEKVYSFTPTTTGVHNLQVTSASGTGYIDYQYKAVSGGCSATGWTCIDDINFVTTVAIGTLTAGVQYYILLDAESTTSSTQTFQINCPAPFDPCASITTLSCGTPVSATPSGTGIWNNNTCLFSTPGLETVYSFTPTVTGVHSIQVNSVSGGYIDYMYKAASGGCSATGWTCIDDINFTGTYSIGTLTAGVQYYILLDPEGTGSYNHNFQIVCPAAIPSCLAAPTSPANGASLCLPGPGTLSWPSAPGATSYDVYFGSSPTPPFVTNTASTSYSTGSLTSGTYYWQIRPANSSGTASGCPVWSFTVDITSPSISNCPNNQNVLKNASCVATLPNYTGFSTTSDNCPGTVTVSQLPAPGTVLNSTVTVTLTATDAAGNTATCSFTATPVDQTPPSITNCPNNQNVLRDANCMANLPNYTGFSTTSDNCPGTISVTQAPSPGTILNGTVTVTLTATDVAGNTATCSFTATPVDQTLPTLSNCPGNQSASVDANCQGRVGQLYWRCKRLG
jgi:membrane-bound inhibitor of C-type lysozyme